jgi:hypothetical protein
MKNLLLVSVFIFFTSTLFAQTATVPTGDGNSGNPYQIATLNNLYWITQTSSSWSSYFIQTADIDASGTSSWNSGAGFSPIGNSTTSFTGSYDGQGNTITSLNINQGNASNIGLFGYVVGATIKNVKLQNVNINLDNLNNVGGLIGEQTGGSITNCHSTGSVSVTGSGPYYVGGLIGLQDGGGSASYCYSSCSVTSANCCGIGCLIGGQSGGTISNCYCTGSVTSTDGLGIGGLIGGQEPSSTATNCYCTGSVTGGSVVGGLIGYQWDVSCAVTNCYSTGSVTGSSAGGLIGWQKYGGFVTNCFWDLTTSTQSTSVGGTGETTGDMKTASTFLAAGWCGSIWNMDGEINNGYPYLKWQNPSGTPIPVELTSFTATATNSAATLHWNTATEVNNYGFDVERRVVSNSESSIANWNKVGFVAGNGASNSPHNYSFTDANLVFGRYAYRLKQVDNDGNFKFSQSLELEVGLVPKMLTLAQNFPNPFNPTTTIEFTVPEDGRVSLKIFDMLGREVASVFEGDVKAGYIQKAVLDASRLSSGVYFSRLLYDGKSLLKKIELMK